MRPILLLGRSCLLRSTLHPSPRFAAPLRRQPFSTRTRFDDRMFSRTYPKPRRKIFLLSAGLSPAAFVTLATQDWDDKKTGEEHMLEVSRDELAQQRIPQRLRESSKIRRGIYFFIDGYIIEPIATGLRFLHLVFIFVPVIVTVPVIWFGGRVKSRDNERSGTLWWYGFLVSSMERAGAAFIKLGQWAASRTDIFPTEMCKIMSSLHSNAPPHSLRRTKIILERAFDGRKFEDIFEEFDETPLGVGAIAQVYRAKLKPDLAASGDVDVEQTPNLRQRVRKNVDVALKSTPSRVPSSYVAVKVLHPKIERIVRRDLKIMGFFAAAINVIPTMEWLSFPDEVAQFGEMMRLQLDLRIEAANLALFRQNFQDRKTAWFPYPYLENTTRQVLVEEFAEGIPLSHFLDNGGGVFQKDIANQGLDAFLRMLIIDNFIHADLHPGNIMVRFYEPQKMDVPKLRQSADQTPQEMNDVTEKVLEELRPFKGDPQGWRDQLTKIDAEGYRPQIIFIDTGLVTELNEVNRNNFLDLFRAIAEFDGYKAGHLMVERCRQPEAVLDSEIFALRMQHLVLGVKSRTFALGNIKIGDLLNEVMSMVRNHHVRLEGDFINVVLSILLLEGIGRSLDPGLDLFAGALPILRQVSAQSGTSILRKGVKDGDLSMLKIWAGLEARSFLQASAESVKRCVKYDLLSPNI